VTSSTFTVNVAGANLGPTTGTGSCVTPNNFTVTAGSVVSASYSSAGSTVTITASTYTAGHQLYLKFASGGLLGAGFDGVYTIATASASSFTVTLGSAPANTSGTCLIPRLSGGYTVSSEGGTSITVSTIGNHNLNVGDQIQIDFRTFNAGTPAVDGIYTVASIIDADHFKVIPPTTISNGTQNTSGLVVYPLGAPPLDRSGTVQVYKSTFNLGSTNTELAMSPLNAPTVFNFYFPDYKFPGTLASSGVTTPEFQLTTDTNVVTLTNAITNSVLASANTNGLSSFRNNGTIRLDLSTYMTAFDTSDANIPGLVDRIAALLTGGPLNTNTRQTIVNFVANTTNFPYTTTGTGPTTTQMRDRVRAIVHLIITSAEYAVQK